MQPIKKVLISAYKDALDLFYSTSGMTVSMKKSSFLYQNVDVDIRDKIAELLLFRMTPLTNGFKYLGYRLKPLGYHTSDWRWMIELFEKKIQNWTYRFLSLGGRVVLIKAVLTGLAVYWFALDRCLKSIMNVLCKTIFSFLWGSSAGYPKPHLVSWETLSLPIEYGGWDIKNLEWFGISLRLKSMWQLLTGTGIWSRIIAHKYFKNRPLEDWI